MDILEFETRKKDHIELALKAENQSLGSSGLDRVHLFHQALPELNLEKVSLGSTCLGEVLGTPFFVAGMTAGHQDAIRINQVLADHCEKRGWAFGVGSLRRDLESPASIDRWADFRQSHPKLFVIANLGASQLRAISVESILKTLEALAPQCVAIHLNSLQEALQPEGTPQFEGVLKAIHELSRSLPVPVIVKETGCGISKATAMKLKSTGIRAIDVSGLGGTHWGRIEGRRAQAQSLQSIAAETFADWGESTADSILNVKEIFEDSIEVWASGGIRSGLDAAKCIALGAHRVGYAKPALEAALRGDVENWMHQQEFELRVALFCTGSKSPEALRGKQEAWTVRSI